MTKVARALRARGKSKVASALAWRDRAVACLGTDDRVCISQIKRGVWTILDHGTLKMKTAQSRAAAIKMAKRIAKV